MTTLPKRPAADASEADWQAWVVALVTGLGGWAYHDHDSRRSMPGFPDLVIWLPPPLPGIERPRHFYAELKAGMGQLRPEQKRVVCNLRDAGQRVEVWRFPADADEVLRVLCLQERPQLERPARVLELMQEGYPERAARRIADAEAREDRRRQAAGGA